MSTATELLSIGRLAALFQEHPAKIRRAIEALNIEPSLRLNETAYYGESSVERIRQQLRRESDK